MLLKALVYTFYPMIRIHKISLLLILLGELHAQDLQSKEAETTIPGPIADGTSSPSVSKPEPINYEVLSSMIKRTFVSEPPEMSDLPQVEGVINTTIQLVADPGLVDPPPPLPELPLDDAAVQSRIGEMREKFPETRLLFVSANVMDHQKTVLRCYPNGQATGEVSVVSNIDYNDFSGFATFNVKAVNRQTGAEEIRSYALVMAISNENSAALSKIQAKEKESYQASALPEPSAGPEPSFVVTDGNDVEALQAIADMHALYKVEGTRMREARIAREKAYEERKAYLLAHPPKPQDVTFKFWKRNQVSPLSRLLENGGDQ